jgi:hypothetical protein
MWLALVSVDVVMDGLVERGRRKSIDINAMFWLLTTNKTFACVLNKQLDSPQMDYSNTTLFSIRSYYQ